MISFFLPLLKAKTDRSELGGGGWRGNGRQGLGLAVVLRPYWLQWISGEVKCADFKSQPRKVMIGQVWVWAGQESSFPINTKGSSVVGSEECILRNIQGPTCSFFFICLFRAAPMAYGGSQARGWIGAASAGLHHSYSNAGSKLSLQPTPQLMATLDS